MLSRGRHANHLHLTREHQLHLEDAAHPATLQPDPMLDDTLAAKLARRRQQQLAIDQPDDRDAHSRAEVPRRHSTTTRREQEADLGRSFGISP